MKEDGIMKEEKWGGLCQIYFGVYEGFKARIKCITLIIIMNISIIILIQSRG